jgi:hypothetical protein
MTRRNLTDMRRCACCKEPARDLQAELDLEQFKGLCFNCIAEQPEILDAPRIRTPDWCKPRVEASERLVRVQGERAA